VSRRGIVVLVALGAAVVAAWRDYRAWRALGVGGLPPNLKGWATVTVLRLRRRDPLHPLRPVAEPPSPQLMPLPHRSAARPSVARHPVPHRVLTGHAPAAVKVELRELFDELRRTAGLDYRTSRWEKHNRALFRGEAEVGHIHPSDGSLHVTLSPADAELVVTRGWGEFHPLAGVAARYPACASAPSVQRSNPAHCLQTFGMM